MLSGCVRLNATKADKLSGNEICIVNNPEVRAVFRDAYERAIRAKGYQTRIVEKISDCPITTTYTAVYRYDWGMYLSISNLTIYENGVLVGEARYKAPRASPITKHGRVENKIKEMVDELLPKNKN
jgi:hypothetical protein